MQENALIKSIRSSAIGDGRLIPTPFGTRPLIYADYTASGRSLTMIEDYIKEHVLPFYANTHSEGSLTGAQSSAFREEARHIIATAVGAGPQDHVIFCGSGATSAINKLIDLLNIRIPANLNDRYSFVECIPAHERPVVFIGPYEHHSNELPWRESIADVVTIPLSENGQLDVTILEKELANYQDRPVKIGSFSAASNVTGVKTDVARVTALLHAHDVLSFWDYAAAGPYVGINMSDNPDEEGDSSKDAIFLSPHKFIGGPGTPGVLVVKEHILHNRVPAMPGGGTVVYVTPEDHRYLDNIEAREEGGTPAIVEAVRAGLVFKLQQQVGTDVIERLETDFLRRAFARWSKIPTIDILGGTELDRLSITSLRIMHQGKDLHHGFVVALLNDLFGIQVRGGCSCAGPYGHQLLGIDMAYSRAISDQIYQGLEIMRPGWVRLNFNYFIDEDGFEYLVRAVELIAEHGWRMLPYYQVDPREGVWRYQGHRRGLDTLAAFDFSAPQKGGQAQPDDGEMQSLSQYLQIAQETLQREDPSATRYAIELPEMAERLRWFA